MYGDCKIQRLPISWPSEYLSEHLSNAKNIPLDFINENLNIFPSDNPFYIHCQSGYRSMIAASILKRNGFHNLVDIEGGFKLIKETNFFNLK